MENEVDGQGKFIFQPLNSEGSLDFHSISLIDIWRSATSCTINVFMPNQMMTRESPQLQVLR